jgi:hypothetical protein
VTPHWGVYTPQGPLGINSISNNNNNNTSNNNNHATNNNTNTTTNNNNNAANNSPTISNTTSYNVTGYVQKSGKSAFLSKM